MPLAALREDTAAWFLLALLKRDITLGKAGTPFLGKRGVPQARHINVDKGKED